MLRMNHIRDISGCGWISVIKNDCKIIHGTSKESYCNIEININWTKLKSIVKSEIAPLRIASVDIEVKSSDGQFPQANRKGDAIIQIGTTYSKYGLSECYRKHLITLNGCSPIDDVVVESYSTEKKVLLAWKKEIIDSDCDILTGYNIFFFDEKYMHDRSELLYIKEEFCSFSKLKNVECVFKEINLSSSALGDNRLFLYDTPGRVHIDLMKYIQKEFKLDSYKLDNVLAEFIKGQIRKVKKNNKNSWTLICETIKDIHENDYIHIETKESFISDRVGKKFLISKIKKYDDPIIVYKEDKVTKEQVENYKLTGEIQINCQLDLDEEINFDKMEVFWSQAKDDVGPKEIFKLQEGNNDDRAIIGKYCVKDCSGCNLLFNKLQVGTNNIQMANVCFVPLQFLFTRGQGIKIFSLVSRKYKKEGYIFPVITKDGDSNDDGYEGAIVFEPVPGIYYAPLSTLDYASLYPSSIIHKNISRETQVLHSSYSNLDDYIYFDSSFVNNDGTVTKCKFAKRKDGKLGVIPQILSDLLKERSQVKQIMAKEKDLFKKNILDGLQLALKITANSLYGQLGAPTSPIFRKELAACTTSTGREMLLFAKKYVEEVYPGIINGIIYGQKDIILKNELIKEIKNDEKKNAKFSDNLLKSIEHVKNKKLTIRPIVRYGDSVVEETPIFVKINDEMKLIKISELGNDWYDYGDKLACNLDNAYSWTEEGWTKIYRVIKHTTNKKIFRIVTNTGLVDVTEDHSLVDINKNKIKPAECNTNTEILHCSFPKFDYDEYDKNFILTEWEDCQWKDGHTEHTTMIRAQELNLLMSTCIECDIYVNPYKNNFVMRKFCNRENKDYRIKQIIDMTNHYYKDKDEIIVYDLETENHHFQAGIGNIVVHNTDSVFTDWQYFENCEEVNENEQLKVWQYIVSFGRKLLGFFISGSEKRKWKEAYKSIYKTIPNLRFCYIDDEDKTLKIVKQFTEERYLPWLWSLQEAYNEGKPNFKRLIFEWAEYVVNDFGLTFVEKDKDYIENGIRFFLKSFMKNYIIQPYVYYMENDKRVIKVKILNNGSRYMGQDALDLSIKTGILSSMLIKSRLPYPHDLEYEKTFDPFLILTKKRYVGHKYEFNPIKYSQNCMGIVLKRRDNAPIVKEICGGIVNKLIQEKNPKGAVKFCKESLNKMINGKYNIKYFLTSKSLKAYDNYKDYTRIPHAVLAKRIGERDPGNEPQSGDRITFGYIKVEGNSKKMLQGEMIETPEYITNNNLEINYSHYIEKQIKNPAVQFLELVIPNAKEIFDEFI